MTLRARIGKLEGTRGADSPDPFVVLVQVIPAQADMRVTGAPLRDGPARFAMIGAGPFGPAENLTIGDGESESAFLSRVEATTLRIHGRLPANWNMKPRPEERAAL